jgi:putative mRNA 3-end processing factor
MEIDFLGGAGEVGRSAILIKDEKNILLDYGIKIDGKTEYPLPAPRVDAYIPSHAHLDHSGFAPALYKSGLPAAFGTEPTKQLAELLIEDSIKLNKRKHEKPKFTRTGLNAFLNRYVSYPYKADISFGNYGISLHDAGHICGSSVVVIEKKGRRIAYTGDLKLSRQLLHNGAEQIKCDILITESTYAIKEHPNRDELVKSFIDSVRKTIENGGIALIPVFAVGRAQEVIAMLHRNGLSQHMFIDGMARKATAIVLEHPEFISNPKLLADGVRAASIIDKKGFQRQNALEGGSIIVTTAGMLNGGPVLDYITRLNDRSMIFLTGYQAEHTNGRRLLDNMPLNIDGESYYVRTPFAFYDFSAHAGQEDLYKFARDSGAEKIICVHGDGESTTSFKDRLEMEGIEAYAPKVGEKLVFDF